jgi:hypothetical protein
LETYLNLSVKEISRLEVMQRLSKKQMSQADAGTILQLSIRQSNNRLAEKTKQRALDALKTKYRGFGPILAHEKPVEKEKLQLSKESVRKLMIEENLWKARKAKRSVVHQLRDRLAFSQ